MWSVVAEAPQLRRGAVAELATGSIPTFDSEEHSGGVSFTEDGG